MAGYRVGGAHVSVSQGRGLRILNPGHYLNFQPHFAVAAAGDPHVQAADLMHEMELVGVQAFAQALVDQGHRHRQLRDRVNTQSGRTKLGNEIAVHVQNEGIAHLIARIAVSGLDHLDAEGNSGPRPGPAVSICRSRGSPAWNCFRSASV